MVKGKEKPKKAEQVLTVVCKMVVPTEAVSKVEATLKTFADACTHINQTIPADNCNAQRIQSLIYQEVRVLFGLSANLTIQTIIRVASNRKTAKQKGKPVKQFAPTSASYDARIFSFREKDWTVSLTLLDSRQRFSLVIADYQRKQLEGVNPTSATLAKHKDGQYYIHIQVKSKTPIVEPTANTLGVDLGRRDIAHTSNGQSFSGEGINKTRDHYAKQRANLQQKASKGTRSTRRRCREKLQRLSGRERGFQTWLNHCISLQIVITALHIGQTIILEDLTGIRERTNKQPRSKTEKRRSNSWAFFQLRQFILYKAQKFGVAVEFVPPAYTSQCCHKCLHIGARKDKEFYCSDCGYKGDADYNAANVIALLGAAVNQPGGPYLVCNLPRCRAAESSAL